MFSVRELRYSYRFGARTTEVLKGVDLEIKRGDFMAIQGPSGSGKSTLFYILGFLLKPQSGRVSFDGTDLARLSDDQLAFIRNRRIGFIFQQFHLLPRATVRDNILLPTFYPIEAGSRASQEAIAKAERLAEKFGLGEHLDHLPNQLSGGQQQRVAIARALMQDVDLILADEPTGNLDSVNAKQILDLLEELNREGKTIVIITHDSEVAKRCRRVYYMKDGVFARIDENRQADVEPATSEAKRPLELKAPQGLAAHARLAAAILPLAFENLWRNKVKSFLTMLGVVIGVASVLSMVTLGQFTKRKVIASYETLGANTLSIYGYSNYNRRATDAVGATFTSFDENRDLKPIKRIFPQVRRLSPVMYDGGLSAIAGGKVLSNEIRALGVDPDFFLISNRRLLKGRALTPTHVENRSPVCVIGFQIAEQLFKRVDPIGQIVTFSDNRQSSFPCRVIGVLASQTSNKSWMKPDFEVLVPTSYFRTVASNPFYQGIYNIVLQIESGEDVVASGKKIKNYFESKYGKSGEFNVDSDSELIAQMKRFLSLFAVLLGAIALISLAVGGIGINNMMLVAVSERLREFGIRKALGSTNRTIRLQVLSESVILCAAAGVIGVVLGFLAYQALIYGATIVVPNMAFEWVFEPVAILLSLVSIIAVGVVSGLAPALKAERLQIIEALRSE